MAGPLNPPAGPVTSSYKTLTEVEPRIAVNAINTPGDVNYSFKITQPGSYYLTGNITGDSLKSGIAISASDVTLDLNGFELAGGNNPLTGIYVGTQGLSHVTIRNGSLRNWIGGVELGGIGSVNNSTVSDLRVGGITGGSGISVGPGAIVERCSVINCTGNGIIAANGGLISDCTAANNGRGIFVGDKGTVTHCSARGNTSRGIETGYACSVVNCNVSENPGDGILLGNSSQARDCVASVNGSTGIRTVSGRATIINCSSIGNSAHGFELANDSTLLDSTALDNLADGIQANSSCRIRRCTARGTNPGLGSVGIHVLSSWCLLEGNSVIAAGIGIKVDQSTNKMVRNTCSANTTNWSIAGGNFGLVVVGAASGGFTGNTGGAASGTTDPDANFSY